MGDWGEAYVVAGGDAASEARVRDWLGAAAHDSDLPMTVPRYSTLARFAPGADFTALTIEGGTAVFDAEFGKIMWLEMHFQMFGDPARAKAREIRRRFKAYCYPGTDEWKREFWKNGSRMLAFLLDCRPRPRPGNRDDCCPAGRRPVARHWARAREAA